MRKALEGYSGGFRIGGKTISNLRYAIDDIVLLATSLDKLQQLVKRVESDARDYNMTKTAAKTKTMTNTEGCTRDRGGHEKIRASELICVFGLQIDERCGLC